MTGLNIQRIDFFMSYGVNYSFPTVFWKFKIGPFDFGNLEDRCTVYDEGKWSCVVKTSRGIQYDWTEFGKLLQPITKELPIQLGYKFGMQEPWMNVYEKGHYQEPHHHIDGQSNLSWCYFHKLPENSGEFGFWNEMYRSYAATTPMITIGSDIAEWQYPEVEEGDLLVFPSFLTHQVTYHKSDERRVTVSGNITVFR